MKRRRTLARSAGLGIHLVLLALATGCAWNANAPPTDVDLGGPSAVIEIEWDDHRPIALVHVDDAGPFRFLVDTGAGGTALSPRCASEAAVRTTDETVAIDAAGNSSRKVVPAGIVDELRIGVVRLRGVSFFVTELEDDLDGVLGFPALAGFLFTLDGPQSRIVLEEGALPDPRLDRRCLDLIGDGEGIRSPRVMGRLFGQKALVLIDSGFFGELFLGASRTEDLDRYLVLDPVQDLSIRTELGTSEVKVGRLEAPLELGDLGLTGLRTIVGSGTPAILGAAILQRLTCTFDHRNQRLRIVRR